MTKSFLLALVVGFILYFAIAWLPWFVRDWINQWKYKRAKKKSGENDEWMYDI